MEFQDFPFEGGEIDDMYSEKILYIEGINGRILREIESDTTDMALQYVPITVFNKF